MLTALTLALLGACGGSKERSQPADGEDSEAQAAPIEEHAPGEEDLSTAELLALPYAGTVDDDPSTEDGTEDGLVKFQQALWYEGYTLYSIYTTGMGVLLDLNGDIIHHWDSPLPARWSHVELLENGDILANGIEIKTEGDTDSLARRFTVRMTWSGEVVWLSHNTGHHEAALDPEGRVVALTAADIRAVVGDLGRRPVRDNLIAVLDEEGDAVESVSMLNMILAQPDSFTIETESLGSRKKSLKDLLHANAISWMDVPGEDGPLYGKDKVAVTMRHQDRVAIFDLTKKELLWNWGWDEISGPHDVQCLPSGNLLLLDNGVASRRSRILEVDPRTNEIAWEWRAPRPKSFFTRTKGSVQRLPNGNHLVGNADNGELFEITPEGEVCWRYVNPIQTDEGRCTLHRARRYEVDFIEGLIAEHGTNPLE